jgi:hypothetical protein
MAKRNPKGWNVFIITDKGTPWQHWWSATKDDALRAAKLIKMESLPRKLKIIIQRAD